MSPAIIIAHRDGRGEDRVIEGLPPSSTSAEILTVARRHAARLRRTHVVLIWEPRGPEGDTHPDLNGDWSRVYASGRWTSISPRTLLRLGVSI